MSTDFRIIALRWFLFERGETRRGDRPPRSSPLLSSRRNHQPIHRLSIRPSVLPSARPPLARLLFNDFLPKSFLFPLSSLSLLFHSCLAATATAAVVGGCSILHRAARRTVVQCLIVASTYVGGGSGSSIPSAVDKVSPSSPPSPSPTLLLLPQFQQSGWQSSDDDDATVAAMHQSKAATRSTSARTGLARCYVYFFI